jgi:hypothetical protein
MEHESSPTGVERREESTGIPFHASPGLERRCGGRAMVTKQWQKMSLVAASLMLR